MSKKVIILVVVVISAALILPPIILGVSIKLRIYEIRYPISFALRLMAMVISILLVIHIRGGLKSSIDPRISAISKAVNEPILFILIGHFASGTIAILISFSMSQDLVFFATAIMLMPVFLSSIMLS